MARRAYRYVKLPFTMGLNEEPELSIRGECETALNAWSPNGRVETRPGYEPHFHLFGIDATVNVADSGHVIIQERVNSTPAGYTNWTTGTTSIASGNDLEAGDRVYFGVSVDPSSHNVFEYEFSTTDNTDTTCAVAWSYWNGSEWKPLRANWVNDANGRIADASPGFLVSSAAGDGSIILTVPDDIATTEVNSSGALYFVRATIIDGTVVGTVDIDMDTVDLGERGDAELAHYGVIELNGTKWYLRGANINRNGTDVSEAEIGAQLGQSDDWLEYVVDSGQPLLSPSEPGSIAVVPEFGEAFASHFEHRMLEYGRVEESGSQGPMRVGRARVEWRDFAVGDKAPFDPAFIAQLSGFPRARYLLHYKGLMWAAGLLGEPYTVRWSAPVPYHRVWPTLSFERLMEDDDSRITGLGALQEQVTVFKQDSIWLMLPVGQNVFGLSDFAPTRVVAGVGCVCNQSIQRIRGRLIFLGEDGIYGFDGTPTIRKVTENRRGADRLFDVFKRITKSRRAWATSVHWKNEECYLLGISLDGAKQNTHTIAWDYGTDAWWLWDIPAQWWFKREDANDEEEIWFVRDDGAVCRLGGRTDNCATITTTLKSHRVMYGDNVREVLRSVQVSATNKTRSLDVQVIPGDNEEAFSAASIDYTDVNEALWSGTVTDLDATAANSTSERRLLKRLGVRSVAEHVQVKLTHDQNNQRFKMLHTELGFIPLGRR